MLEFDGRVILMRTTGLLFALTAFATPGGAQTDWPTFGHDFGSTRYSPVKQITPANVNTLTRAWTYHMNPGGANSRGSSSETIPLVVGGMMYVTTPYQRVVALEPETGKQTCAFKVPEVIRRGVVCTTGRAMSRVQN